MLVAPAKGPKVLESGKGTNLCGSLGQWVVESLREAGDLTKDEKDTGSVFKATQSMITTIIEKLAVLDPFLFAAVPQNLQDLITVSSVDVFVKARRIQQSNHQKNLSGEEIAAKVEAQRLAKLRQIAQKEATATAVGKESEEATLLVQKATDLIEALQITSTAIEATDYNPTCSVEEDLGVEQLDCSCRNTAEHRREWFCQKQLVSDLSSSKSVLEKIAAVEHRMISSITLPDTLKSQITNGANLLFVLIRTISFAAVLNHLECCLNFRSDHMENNERGVSPGLGGVGKRKRGGQEGVAKIPTSDPFDKQAGGEYANKKAYFRIFDTSKKGQSGFMSRFDVLCRRLKAMTFGFFTNPRRISAARITAGEGGVDEEDEVTNAQVTKKPTPTVVPSSPLVPNLTVEQIETATQKTVQDVRSLLSIPLEEVISKPDLSEALSLRVRELGQELELALQLELQLRNSLELEDESPNNAAMIMTSAPADLLIKDTATLPFSTVVHFGVETSSASLLMELFLATTQDQRLKKVALQHNKPKYVICKSPVVPYGEDTGSPFRGDEGDEEYED